MARPLQITDDTIVKALATGGEVTAAELADRLGMGQSTAAKRLAALEASGAVRRTPGGRVNGVRARRPLVERRPPRPTAPEPVVPDTDVSATGGTAPVETVRAEPAGPGGSGRLGRGALGTLVRDYLAARPGEAFGPSRGRQGPRPVPGGGVQLAGVDGGARRSGAGRRQAPPVPDRQLTAATARTPRPGTPLGTGYPTSGFGPTPKWGSRAGLRTPRRRQGSPERIFWTDPPRHEAAEYPASGLGEPHPLTSHDAPGGAIDPAATPDVGSARAGRKWGRFGVNPG